MSQEFAPLYLIPNRLGSANPLEVVPLSVKKAVESLNHFVVENEKNARRFIKDLCPKKNQQSLQLFPLNKYTPAEELPLYLQPCLQGIAIGLLSEAGSPAVADPGADLVRLAHEKGIRVIPLVGPSSILLALMASGMNGQSFAFVGYLPIDKKERRKVIKELEQRSKELHQTQILIETPYRNEVLYVDLLGTLSDTTLLGIAVDITEPDEFIKTLRVKEWKKQNPKLHKRPAIFSIQKE